MTELIYFEHDITTVCVTAETFPEGVGAAHQKLHRMVAYSPERKYFGISYCLVKEQIIYHAATEIAPEDDADNPEFDVFFIKKGAYLSVLISNFMNDLPGIGCRFRELLADPRVDSDGYCLEWYLNKEDMRCMVRLKD